MYNAFIVRKKAIEADQMKKKSQANTKYVHRYLNVTRPALLDSHNKKINSFIRKMQEEPIRLNLDPALKSNQFNLDSPRKGKSGKRSFSNHGAHQRGNSFDYSNIQRSHIETFKFKDKQDWKSLLTPFERIQRKKNFQLFKQKYGDPSIAYRSIGSQSQYKPGHEFRQRKKSMEVNPPMKYTNKPTKQILAKLKQNKKNEKNRTHYNKTSSDMKQEQILKRHNTGSSMSGINDDGLISDNNTVKASREDEDSNRDYDSDGEKEKGRKGKQNGKVKQKQVKLHFKEIMQLQQNLTDFKTKRALKDILYRCGVYRRKNKRVVTDSQIDQLSEFTDGR